MNSQNWLTLMEYSSKYRVSISTLRRRIKSEEIEFQFADGKYLLLDAPVTQAPEVVAASPARDPGFFRSRERRPVEASSPSAPVDPVPVNATEPELVITIPPALVSPATPAGSFPDVEKQLAELATGLREEFRKDFNHEIKKAYAQIMQEKEQQILQLRSEVSDLRTLVRVLEEQNNDLKNHVRQLEDQKNGLSLTGPKFELDLEL